MRISALHVFREILLDRFAHRVAALCVERAVFLDVPFEVIIFHVHRAFPLGGARRGQVGRALHEIDLRHDLVIRHEPCETHARSERLGERAGINDEVFRVHGDERIDLFPFEAEIAVRIIFDHRDLILRRESHESLTAFQRPTDARGVLVIRDDIDEFHTIRRFEELLQFFRDHAFAVRGDFHEFRLIQLERVDRAQVGRAFDEDDVILVEEDTADDVEALLRTGGDDHILRFHLVHAHGAVHAVHAVGDILTELHEAHGRAVLHGASAVFFTDFHRAFRHFLQRKRLRSRQAAGERNDLRLRRQSEQRTEIRVFDCFQSAGKTNCHKTSLLYFKFWEA